MGNKKKNLSRRDFIKASFAATACCAAGLGPSKPNIAHAMAMGGSKKTVVFFNQFGGNDHLNSWAIPYSVSAYYDRRPTLSIPTFDVLTMAQGIGLHPSMPTLHSLYNDGDVAIIQGCGDPIGNRSHFTSQQYFSQGVIDPIAISDRRGWIGRLGDLYFTDVPFNTFGIGVGLKTDFTSNRSVHRPIVTGSITSFGFINDHVLDVENNHRRKVVETMMKRNKVSSNARKNSVRINQNALYDGTQIMEEVVADYSSLITYPSDDTGRMFNDAARLISTNLIGTQVIYGGGGGWDTHSNQATGQQTHLSIIDQSLAAFSTDIKALGKWNDTAICIFTEFGRKTFENGSFGTDHGWGGAMVVIGGGINGGIYGSTPSDNEIRNQEWLYMDIDFRNVFSEIITWLGYNPAPVFPETYTKTTLNII